MTQNVLNRDGGWAANCNDGEKKTEIQELHVLLVTLCNALLSFDPVSLTKGNEPLFSFAMHSKREYLSYNTCSKCNKQPNQC